MIVLGIETSCDDTSVALVEDGVRVVDQITSSQVKIHSKFSGVVPELASRAHLANINGMLEKLFKNNPGTSFDAVGATYGPGLVGSLLIGYVSAEVVSYLKNVPLVEVNHLEGHIYSSFLNKTTPPFPFLSMIISGGHTDLVLVENFGVYKILGRTRDDACGEAFDKVAKLLELGYPGGPVIDKLYGKGDAGAYSFPVNVLPESLDFSFSGLKTSVLYKLREVAQTNIISGGIKADIAASFQKAAVTILVKKLLKALTHVKVNNVALGGGVTSNSLLRAELREISLKSGFELFLPPVEFCVDNAAMIASTAYYKILNNKHGSNGVFNKKCVQSQASILNW